MINQIVNGDYLKSLDNIIQWQEIDVFKKESVASHSYKVAVIARILLEDVLPDKDAFCNLFKLEVTTACLFHDWDEILIRRDISHDTKYNEYNGDLLRQTLNDYVKYRAKQEFKEKDVELLMGERSATETMLSEAMMVQEKAVKSFVKVCDWMALMHYVLREISLGNVRFLVTKEYCSNSLIKAIDVLIRDIERHPVFFDVTKNICILQKLKDYGRD